MNTLWKIVRKERLKPGLYSKRSWFGVLYIILTSVVTVYHNYTGAICIPRRTLAPNKPCSSISNETVCNAVRPGAASMEPTLCVWAVSNETTRTGGECLLQSGYELVSGPGVSEDRRSLNCRSLGSQRECALPRFRILTAPEGRLTVPGNVTPACVWK